MNRLHTMWTCYQPSYRPGVWILKMCGWEEAIDGTHTSSDIVLKNDLNNKYDIRFDKRQLEIYFQSILNNIVIENTCHLSKSPIIMYRNYTVCVHVHNLHRVQINLHHPEGRSKFAPGCEFLKHRSHVQKYTRVQICTRCKLRT